VIALKQAGSTPPGEWLAKVMRTEQWKPGDE
jgi:hypothetical protein